MMGGPSRRVFTKQSLTLLALGWFAPSVFAAPAAETILPQQVELDVHKASGGDKATLRFIKVSASSGDSVPSLLERQGVVADGEALSIVYAKNPKLSGPKLHEYLSLELPSIRKMDGSACGSACEVALTLDAAQKTELHDAVTKSQGQLAQASRLDEARFGGADKRKAYLAEVTRAVDAVTTMNQIVQSRSKPVTRDTLTVSLGEAQVLKSLLDTAPTSAAETDKAVATALEIRADLVVRLRSFDEQKAIGDVPGPLRKVPFEVRTVSGPDKQPVNSLRVYWCAVALLGKPDQYRQLSGASSPVSAALGEANYLFWASKPGSDEVVTERLRVELRASESSSPQRIELIVVK